MVNEKNKKQEDLLYTFLKNLQGKWQWRSNEYKDNDLWKCNPKEWINMKSMAVNTA